jgi:hypothetical protein
MSLVFHRILDLKTGVYIYTAPFFCPYYKFSSSFRKRTFDVSIMNSQRILTHSDSLKNNYLRFWHHNGSLFVAAAVC